jgi:nucleoside-diphosphate-sugar epimerase
MVWVPFHQILETSTPSWGFADCASIYNDRTFMSQAPRAVVTGGGGFLGSNIVSMLLAEGCLVRNFSRNEYPELKARGVECHRGDLADSQAVCDALQDTDVVFHVAAKAGIWGDYSEYYSANVTGTRNVIEACRRNRVPRLVYTSTPSVAFGGHDVRNANEDEPLPQKYLAPYLTTKAAAERLVLQANSSTLATVALRPHLIWGPGDTQLFPRIVERRLANRLMLVGSGDNLIDSTFVENAARAHLDAAKRLKPGSPVAGRAYFISQGDPRPVRDMINALLNAAGLPPVKKSVPLPVAYVLACVLEVGYRLFHVAKEPPVTRLSVLEMGRDHYFDISAARRDLGYHPAVSIEEGLERVRSALATGQSVKSDTKNCGVPRGDARQHPQF